MTARIDGLCLASLQSQRSLEVSVSPREGADALVGRPANCGGGGALSACARLGLSQEFSFCSVYFPDFLHSGVLTFCIVNFSGLWGHGLTHKLFASYRWIYDDLPPLPLRSVIPFLVTESAHFVTWHDVIVAWPRDLASDVAEHLSVSFRKITARHCGESAGCIYHIGCFGTPTSSCRAVRDGFTLEMK